MSEENGYANDLAADAAAAPATESAQDGDSDGIGGTTERQLAEQRDKYLRLAAEYDNFRKRTARERQDAHLRGQSDMLKGMIDSLDDLGRFAHVDPATTDAKTIADGVSMVEKKLLKTLGGHGLEVIDPAGRPFDPAQEQGYRFNGQLLRPARVAVKQWNG